MATDDDLYVRTSGAGEPTLLLLHGLGATAEVWDGLLDLLADRWPGTVLAPDLPGHGRSPGLPRYSFGAMAAEVARVVPAGPVVVLGHSLGGVLGLALGSGWFGVPVAAVCGVGIKVRWTDDELRKASEFAARPRRVFGTREEAVARWLRTSGLAGLIAADSPVVDAGVAADGDGWAVRLDPAAFGVGDPPMPGLLAACRGEVILAAGEHDPMSPSEHLLALRSDAVTLPGVGHNAHVRPATVLQLIDRLGELAGAVRA